MRNVYYSAACSLDGFIHAGDGDTYEWIRNGPKADAMLTELWADTDTLVMGRKTWDMAQQMAGSNEASNPFKGVHSYVFSRTLESIEKPGVTLVHDDPVAFVRDLKSRPGKRIFAFGGAQLVSALVAAGVVDELALAVQPVLLGGGIPLLAPLGRQVQLELKASAELDQGAVRLVYALK